MSKVTIDVLSKGSNNAPIIESLKAESKTIFMGKDTTLTCLAKDPDGQQTTHVHLAGPRWSHKRGRITGHLDRAPVGGEFQDFLRGRGQSR